MGVKSIVEVDIRDAAFKNFQKQFSKYQSSLDKMPAAWQKVDSAVKSANGMDKMRLVAAGTALQIKQAESFQKKFTLAVQGSGRAMGVLAKGTAAIAKNIAKATLSLLKWASLTGLISGLVGAGGLFGIDRLALSASNQRRQSQGLGVSAGALRSAQVNFGKFTDVDSTLENVANSRSDLSKRWIFAALGVDPSKGSNVDVMAASLKAAKHSFEQNGMTQQGADAHGLTQLYSMDDLRRLHAMTDKEIDDSVRKQEADAKSLAVTDRALGLWQDLSIQLTRAGAAIENLFIRKLTNLSGPIARLSDSVAKAFDTFLDSPKIGEWIDGFGDAIQRFAKYLTSPDFKSDMDAFIDGVQKAASALKDLFGWINDKLKMLGVIHGAESAGAGGGKTTVLDMDGNVIGQEDAPPSTTPTQRPTWGDLAAGTSDAIRRKAGLGNAYFADIEKQNDLPPGILRRIEKAESGYQVDALSPKGAMGAFQLMPATAKRYGVKDSYNLVESATGAARYLHDLMKMFNGNIQQVEASYNWGEGNVKKDVDKYGDDWKAHIPKETRDYLAKLAVPGDTQRLVVPQDRGGLLRDPVIIEIRNNTGGSAVTTTNALAY